MSQLFDKKSPFRIFGISLFLTLALLAGSIYASGWGTLPILLALLVIEITFSFENAVINAKILATLSRFWQTLFLTVGILIAIFGMRIVFPIVLVAIAADTSWQVVLDTALNDPDAYAAQLEIAYPSIAAFGGAFLMMLALTFFIDKHRTVDWFVAPERFMQQVGSSYMPTIVTAVFVGFVGILPMNEHPRETFTAGAVGIVTFIIVHGMAEFFTRIQSKGKKKSNNKIVIRTGMAAFLTFLYLELLDASFSLDSVIGAFAITDQVLLIAAGLGIGAVWVRSMTVYMVRRGTLANFRYLEHGAHYTVLVLALTMFLAELVHVPEAFAGLAGIIIIGASYVASKKAGD
jgi:hypothetical protein